MVLEHHEDRPFRPGVYMILLVFKQQHIDVYMGFFILGVSSRGNALHLNKGINRDLGKIYSIFFPVF